MINTVAGINVVKSFDNVFTIGVVVGMIMDVTWTGKYTVFHLVTNT